MGKRILIVDPSGPHRRNLSAMLAAEGFECSTATDGLEALAKAFYERPQVVLVEPDVAGLSGPGLCQALKADSLTALIPVVFVSTRYSMELLQAALDSGAMDYLQKPLDSKLLLSRLTHYTSEQYVTGQNVFFVADSHPTPVSTRVLRHHGTKVYLEKPNWGRDVDPLIAPGAHAEIHHAADDFSIYRRRAVVGHRGHNESAEIEIHLATGVYRAQRRLTFRQAVHMPARYKAEGGFFRLATIVEICGSGFRMTGLHDSLEVGTEFRLEFKIPQRSISVPCRVSWRLADDAAGVGGVQALEDDDPSWRLELTRFLFKDLIQPLPEAMPATS